MVSVTMGQPFKVYSRTPAAMADVKPSSFIGVTTVKQADRSELATEIHVFPEELRGLGEGADFSRSTTRRSRAATSA